MAGKLIVDTIDTDNSFITLNVQQSLIATMNVSGIYSNTGVKMIGANGTVSNTAITGNIISSQITSVANTQITGNIASSQITSNPTLYGNVSVTGVIGVGGATTSTSGSGITFPATQSDSSNVNTLDDYEEGTWTPTDGSGAGLTFTNIQAFYTKVGRLVTLNASFTFPSTASATAIGISGAPFTYNFSNAENCAAIFDYAGLGANQVYFAATSFDIRAAGSGTVRANSTFSLKRLHLMVSYSTSA